MAKNRQAEERGRVMAPKQPANHLAARQLFDKSSDTSAASRVLDVLRLLGLTEAALYDELMKRRRDESPPNRNKPARDHPILPEQMPKVRDERVRRILDSIELQPGQSVQRLAREAGLCPDHLQRLFKQETGGGNLRELLGERRLQKAAELLLAADMSIKEIAYVVGYKHQSSFVRAFQREFAQTPGHYRRRKDSPPIDGAKRQ